MKLLKKTVPVILAIALVLSSVTTAMACTGVYVGSAVSENGSTYMGRSEDIGDTYGKIFGVADPQDIPEGAVYKDTYGLVLEYDKIAFDYPSKTYAYTYVKDSPNYGETMKDSEGNPVGEAYAEAGQNEKGVSMSATVSTNYNNDAQNADRLVRTGLREISMTSLVLGGAATAREGVELLAAIIDVYGAGECNSIMLSDANETWYMEIVSGHQYAAIKMPLDKVSVQPNIMLLGVIDVTDTENVIVSENLVKLAQDNGFLETDADGKINVAKTYAKENAGGGQYSRYWQGLYYVNKTAAELIKNTVMATNMGVDPLPLLATPDQKFSTLEVLKLLAYRGEGTEMDSNTTNYSAIGNNRQTECHIFETRANMPTDLAVLQWQAMADAEFSIYLPYYSALVTEVHESYDSEVTKPRNVAVTDEQFLESTEDSLNWNFQIINNLCYNNRALCADSVKAFFIEWQKSLIEQQAAIDSEMAQVYAYSKDLAKEKATALGKDLADQTFKMTSKVRAELVAYLAGDKAEPFTLSAEVTEMMPTYSFANVGGNGLPPVNDNPGNPGDGTNDGGNGAGQQPGNQPTDNNAQTPADKVTDEVPKTGDDTMLMVFVLMALASCTCAVVLKKKTQK